jgi:hypothetical protein
MIVRLQKIDTTVGDDSFRSHRPLAEPSMIAEHANIPPQLQAGGSNRRLRNRIILVNVVAWVVIIVAIRAIFF